MFRLLKTVVEIESGAPCPCGSLPEVAAIRRAKHFSVFSQTLRTLEDAKVKANCTDHYEIKCR